MKSDEVNLAYSGKLSPKYELKDIIGDFQDIAEVSGYKYEIIDKVVGYSLPLWMIMNPKAVYWKKPYISCEDVVREIASRAGILNVQEKPHSRLCKSLLNITFPQRGIYIWIDEKADPLRLVFGNDDRLEEAIEQRDPDIPDLLYIRSTYRLNIKTYLVEGEISSIHKRICKMLRYAEKHYFEGGLNICDESGFYYSLSLN